MLDEFLKKLSEPEQTVIVDALTILQEFGVFEHILRYELIMLGNTVISEHDLDKIHATITSFKAKEQFVSQLLLSIPKGD